MARAGSGSKVPRWFEGGQMPLQRRLPKRGFTHLSKIVYQVVNLSTLEKMAGVKEITPALLAQKRIIADAKGRVKVLGMGELKSALTVKAHAFSQSARKAIEAAGGSVEIIAAH